jgi:flagellar protein FlaG
MNEESGLIGAVGALSPVDDYVSAHDNSSPQASSGTAATSAANASPRPSGQAVQTAVDQINAHLAGVDRVLSLKLDPSSGYTVAEISNALTGEVLQQIPTEDGIRLEQMLARWSHGGNVLMDLEA